MTEATVSQSRYGVGDGNGGQAGATREAIVSQTRYGIGNGDGGQAGALKEAIVSQFRYGVGNDCAFKTSNHAICLSLNNGIAIIS